eukprot:8601714-Pyramimonas_sp.AAC.1
MHCGVVSRALGRHGAVQPSEAGTAPQASTSFRPVRCTKFRDSCSLACRRRRGSSESGAPQATHSTDLPLASTAAGPPWQAAQTSSPPDGGAPNASGSLRFWDRHRSCALGTAAWLLLALGGGLLRTGR